MEAYKNQAQYFKVLMHPTRLAILDMLREGEQCVCHMEAVLGLRQAHISQHLMVLREVGLVSDRREGWNIFYRVSQPKVYTVIDAMEAFSGATTKIDPKYFHAKEATCPCPKCSPVSDRPQLIPSDLAVPIAESAG